MLRLLLSRCYVRGVYRLAQRLESKLQRSIVRPSGMGVKMRFDLSQSNELFSYYFFVDDLYVRTWKRYLSPGDCFIDVGANAGFYSAHAAAAVGSQGLVLAIEPNCDMVARTQEVIELNGFTNIEIIESAASYSSGESCLLIGSEHGLTRLKDDARQAVGIDVVLERTVGMITIDSLEPRLASRPLAGMKLDIEGHEFHALQGARELISIHRPLLQLEFNATLMGQYGIQVEQAAALFDELNYTLWVPQFPRSLIYWKSNVPLVPFEAGAEPNGSTTDLWACPSEKEPAFLNAWQQKL